MTVSILLILASSNLFNPEELHFVPNCPKIIPMLWTLMGYWASKMRNILSCTLYINVNTQRYDMFKIRQVLNWRVCILFLTLTLIMKISLLARCVHQLYCSVCFHHWFHSQSIETFPGWDYRPDSNMWDSMFYKCCQRRSLFLVAYRMSIACSYALLNTSNGTSHVRVGHARTSAKHDMARQSKCMLGRVIPEKSWHYADTVQPRPRP